MYDLISTSLTAAAMTGGVIAIAAALSAWAFVTWMPAL